MSKARSTGNIGNIVKASVTGVTISDGTNDLLSISSNGDLSVVGNINASTLDGIDGASFLQTGSFNSFSSSIDTTIKNKLNADGVISGSAQINLTSSTGYSTFSGSIATTTSNLSSSIGGLSSSVATTTSNLSSSIGSLSSSVAITTSDLSSSIGSLSSSVATTTNNLSGRITTIEGRGATTGSNIFIGNQTITGSICTTGNIVTTGQIVAQTINVQQVTSSIVYSCGSNIFGCSITDIQQITGSLRVTGSNALFNVNCIGIGTTTPFRKLTVDTSDVASDGVVVRGNSSPAYTICETSGVGSTFTNDSAAGYIGTNTNHPFNVRTNSQNRLTFSNSGIAGFACQVCVTGNADTAAGLIVNNSTGNSGTCQHYINFTAGATTIGRLFRGNGVSGAVANGLNIDNFDGFQVRLNQLGGSGGTFNILGGNIGIGTTNPSVLLQLGEGSLNNGTTNQYLRINSGGYNALSYSHLDLFNFGNNFGNPLGWRITSGTESTGISVGRSLSFSTVVTDGNGNPSTATERMRITSSGLVGINTTNFGERLNIGCGGAIAWQNTCNCQRWHIQYRGTEDGLNFVESAVADFRLFLKAGGNVGIGVNPNYKLEVSGNACFTGGVAIGGSYCAFALNVHGVTYQIGGSTWVQNGYGYVNAGATTTGLFPMSDSTMQFRVNNSSALTINSAGVSCFISTVCAPGIYVGNAFNNTILSSSRVHLNTCVQRLYTINHWELSNGSFSCTVTDSAATYGCAKVMPLGGSSTYFFGPYSYLTPGSYVAKFRMKVDNNSSTSTLFYLDTVRGGGVNVSPNTFCTSNCYQYINLPFTISSPSDVFEARALSYTPNITCAYLDHVLIEAQENPGQYFSKDNFRLYTGHFNTPRLNIDTNGNTIFNCNGTYCSNYGYNFLTACNGTILSGAHIMGNMGAGTFCATPLWCLNGGNGGSLRMEFNWATNNFVNWTNHNNCTPFLLNYSADNFATKHCFDYVGNACHCGMVIARGYQGMGFSNLSAGAGTGTASFDTITRSGVGLYEVSIIANPNAGGSDYYDFWYGHLIIGRGYNGSAVTDYISWCQESPPPRTLYPSGGGGLTVTACMLYGGAEYSNISRDGSYTIRFKISGYNSSYTGAGTTIFLKLLI